MVHSRVYRFRFLGSLKSENTEVKNYIIILLLHCALSLAAQCIAIGPVCLCVFVCLFVCGPVTTITQNCVY